MSTSSWRPLLPVLCAALLAGADCNPFGKDEDPPAAPAPVLLASGDIGPAGGTVQVTSGPKAGVKIDIPAGALSTTETITIKDATGTGTLPPKICDFLIEPEGLAFITPATVTVVYSSDYASDWGISVPLLQLHVVSRTAQDDPEVLVPSAADAGARTVTVQTAHLSRFAALLTSANIGSIDHYRYLGQKRMLVDQVETATIGSETYVVAATQPGGTTSVPVGKSTPPFWSSNNNLILIHSTEDDATNFTGGTDLTAGLFAEYANIRVYQYKSGRPIAENGNWLYNEIKANAQPGFECDIVGYSLGGIVGRYAIEGSPNDAARQNLANYDAATSTGPLSALVDDFFTLGSPNDGVTDSLISILLTAAGLSVSLADDYLPGLTDNSGTTGTTQILNAAYVDDPQIAYFFIAGHHDDPVLSPLIPGFDDGLVSTDSATAAGALTLVPPEEAKIFPGTGTPDPDYSHTNLHSLADSNGIVVQIINWKTP